MNRNRILLCSALLFFFITACVKESERGPSLHKDYFPVGAGHSVTYEVDSMLHDSALELHDTSHYFIREKISRSFIDDEGRKSYRIERFRKDSQNGDWSIADVWVADRNDERAEKVEENRRFIKMVFPVAEGKQWDGNAYNTLEEEEYEYREVHDPRTVGGSRLDSTVKVLHQDLENLIERRSAYEVYAKGIGMVQKERVELETYTSGEIRQGSELYMNMTEHHSP